MSWETEASSGGYYMIRTLKILLVFAVFSGCTSGKIVTQKEFLDYQKRQSEELKSIIATSDQTHKALDLKIDKKIEFSEFFYNQEDNKIQELLAARTEQRFSDIRQYLENLEKGCRSKKNINGA
jgi:hypothetical protein